MNFASFDSVTFSKTARAAILAGAWEVGGACKVAFTYGLETDPVVSSKFLNKPALHGRHPHIVPNTSNLKPAKNHISLKDVTYSFSGMPKQSASHKDNRTWELLRDAAIRPSTAAFLRSFAEHFSNGALPKDL